MTKKVVAAPIATAVEDSSVFPKIGMGFFETPNNWEESQSCNLTQPQARESRQQRPTWTKDFVFVKVGNLFRKVFLRDIDYVVYADRYSNLVIEGKLLPLNMGMKELAKNLPTTEFIQIHQSYIVNINKIQSICIYDNYLDIVGNTILPIGVSFKKNLQKQLFFWT